MSICNTRQLLCQKCGEEFDVEVWDSVNVTLDPEMRDKVLSREIYEFKCPKCGEVHRIVYPFLYHDMKNKFMVHSGSLGGMLDKAEFYKQPIDNLIGMVLEGYTFCGTLNLMEFEERIKTLESGYDYRVIEMLKAFWIQRYNSERKNGKYPPLKDIFVDYNNENKLIIVIAAGENDDDTRYMPVEIDDDLYSKLKENFKDDLAKANTFLFNLQSAFKIFKMRDAKEKGEEDTHVYHFGIYEDRDGDKQIGFIQSLNEDKFNEGDFVGIHRYGEKNKVWYLDGGKLTRIIKMTDAEYPFEINDLPIITYKTEDLVVETSRGSEDEIFNQPLFDALKAYEANNYKAELIPFELFDSSDVILGTITTADLSPEQIANLKPGQTFSFDDIKTVTKYVRTIKDDCEYLTVYLTHDDVPDDGTSKFIYKFKDIIEIYKNHPGKFDGIILINNKEEFLFPNALINEIEMDKIMTNANRMKEFLLSLTDKEISFIGKNRYEAMCDIYVKGYSLARIKKENNYTKDDLDDLLGWGYSLVKRVILTRF